MTQAAEPPHLTRPQVLRKRTDFLRAARAGRAHTPAFTLQARDRSDASPDGGVRVGFTCSKKVGNAVARNRAKRRLRAIAADVFPRLGKSGWDYVLIGRPNVTASHPFQQMAADLETALAKVHSARRPKG
ncbi:MAG: ribonuclease P protein component [Pseudomonadota bacterium]